MNSINFCSLSEKVALWSLSRIYVVVHKQLYLGIHGLQLHNGLIDLSIQDQTLHFNPLRHGIDLLLRYYGC